MLAPAPTLTPRFMESAIAALLTCCLWYSFRNEYQEEQP
jgi:hypothetical protein